MYAKAAPCVAYLAGCIGYNLFFLEQVLLVVNPVLDEGPDEDFHLWG